MKNMMVCDEQSQSKQNTPSTQLKDGKVTKGEKCMYF